MTRNGLLEWMRRHEVPEDEPLCQLCFGKSGHPPIDGIACYPCILQRGRWAAEPESLSVDQATALWAAHEDVLELRRCPLHDTVEWNWIGWPA